MSNSVRPWLDRAGKFTVEHISGIPYFNQAVDLDASRTGVLHTTEGSTIDGALEVFKQHFAPQFLLGRDAKGAVRILQLVQVGTIGAALVTHNDHAIVQVEVASFSKQTPWLFDDETVEALASLMAVCKREYGIPLTRPWADGDYGLAGNNPHRAAGKWGVVAGWFAPVSGSPKNTKSSRNLIEGVARAHSVKPEEAYRWCELYMPGARRVELFSRTSRPGWDTWGFEAGKFDATVALGAGE